MDKILIVSMAILVIYLLYRVSMFKKEKAKYEREYEEKERVLFAIKEQEFEEVERKTKLLTAERKKLQKAEVYYTEQAKRYEDAFKNVHQHVVESILKPIRISEERKREFVKVLCTERGKKALEEPMFFCEVSQIECKVRSSSGKEYDTSLNWCKCGDQKNRGGICKHMLSLAIQIGAVNVNKKDILEEYEKKLTQTWDLDKKNKQLEGEIKEKKQTIAQLENKQQALTQVTLRADTELKELIKNRCAAYPQFAAMYADVYTYYYDLAAHMLLEKAHPAKGEALRIKELRRHTREHIEEKKVLEYQLRFAKNLYPGISQIFNEDFDPQNAPILEPNKNFILDKNKNPRG